LACKVAACLAALLRLQLLLPVLPGYVPSSLALLLTAAKRLLLVLILLLCHWSSSWDQK
jgi:hypothetical protein